jgi:uncharacterized Rmd1/YagE family protein
MTDSKSLNNYYRYGVVVFFGFSQRNELDILDDLVKQGIMVKEKKIGEKKQYETENFHFEYDPLAPTPRIYNDFFSEYSCLAFPPGRETFRCSKY